MTRGTGNVTHIAVVGAFLYWLVIFGCVFIWVR